MASSTGTIALAAFQSSISVLLTLAYGIIAGKYGILNEDTNYRISKLCLNFFLPALYIVQIGPELSFDHLKSLGPLFLWALFVVNLGAFLGLIGKAGMSSKFVGLDVKYWVVAACGSNNGNAMPFLLLNALGSTTALSHLTRGEETIDQAVERGKGYVLIYALVQQTWTLLLVPILLRADLEDESSRPSGTPEEEESLLGNTEGLDAPIVVSSRHHDYNEHEEEIKPGLRAHIMHFLGDMRIFLTPPIFGAFLALFLGLVEPLHALLLDRNNSPLYASVTSSLKNIGELFTSLQMVVLGAQLLYAWRNSTNRTRHERNAIIASNVWVFVIRFVFMPVFSIGIIWILIKHDLLVDDPMLWFIMMIIPCGPTALTVGALAEVERVDQADISTLLVVSYIVSPAISFAATGALKAIDILL